MSSPKRQTLPLLPLCHCNGNWREPATVIRAIIVAIAEPNIGTAEMIDSSDPELRVRPDDRKLSELTWLASKSFQSGDLAGAARRCQEILTQFPNDPVAKSMLTECFPSIVPAPPRHSAK